MSEKYQLMLLSHYHQWMNERLYAATALFSEEFHRKNRIVAYDDTADLQEDLNTLRERGCRG